MDCIENELSVNRFLSLRYSTGHTIYADIFLNKFLLFQKKVSEITWLKALLTKEKQHNPHIHRTASGVGL